MEAAQAGRVVELSNRIQTIQQAIELIDDGATIIAMTLQRPEPIVEPAEPAPPTEPELDEEGRPIEAPVTEPEEPELRERGSGEMIISTEGLTHPPQMMEGIREQEVQIWKSAYDELAGLGVTNVPPPPGAAPQAAAAPQVRRATQR